MATEDDVREIALGLPETTEAPWYGAPAYKVKGKGFLRLRTEAEGGLVVFVSDLAEKEALLASDSGKFFTTPHYDGYPTVLVNLEAMEVDELRELIIESWREKAPRRVLAAYDTEHGSEAPPA
ncbi:MAG: YjbR family protein [uncultured Acidimicrobiales bacterium]|uniref:YjbR family protein n=1 Tax=uncultured Acidimicrobiales bacterium TaxID=310071 RepID=A0A6J4IEN6_9ACTN|nr:MAG: YjbR family protein [uncultured Acidimicrobiales bacterium]